MYYVLELSQLLAPEQRSMWLLGWDIRLVGEMMGWAMGQAFEDLAWHPGSVICLQFRLGQWLNLSELLSSSVNGDTMVHICICPRHIFLNAKECIWENTHKSIKNGYFGGGKWKWLAFSCSWPTSISFRIAYKDRGKQIKGTNNSHLLSYHIEST